MANKEQDSNKALSDLLEFGKNWDLEHKNKIIGYYIQKRRKSMKMTQKQLGELIGKTESSIQKYESGKTEIPRSVLEKIASVLGVHILELLDTTSGIAWLNTRDDAIIALLTSLGCETIIGTTEGIDKSIIYYKGVQHVIDTDLITNDLFPDIEDDVMHLVEKLLKKYSSKNKSEVPEEPTYNTDIIDTNK